MKGTIFNIEEFAVHDGPGIRKLVFFKGCALHCKWCHNPEGISSGKELMVSHTTCIHCGRCVEICSNEKCNGCGKCVGVCPLHLRKICGQEIDGKDLAKELLKGKDILINSGGGITISGGEPLTQPDFLFELIEHIKPINIAVETSGHAASHIFQKMASMVDLVLFDVKHTDTEIHKEYTGVDNYHILENLDFLCCSNTDFYVRVPLIPGVNDTRENMEKTALLVSHAKHLIRVELLPYHKTAGVKYGMMNKYFDPGFDTRKMVNVWKDVFENYNINIIVL